MEFFPQNNWDGQKYDVLFFNFHTCVLNIHVQDNFQCGTYMVRTYALSFYRSQNVLGWSKFLVPDQNFIYMLWQSKTFSARQKDDLHSVQLFFFSKVFEKALNAVKLLGWLKIFGPAQIFWDL